MQLQLGGLIFDKTQWMSSKLYQGFPSAHILARAARCEFPQEAQDKVAIECWSQQDLTTSMNVSPKSPEGGRKSSVVMHTTINDSGTWGLDVPAEAGYSGQEADLNNSEGVNNQEVAS